MRKIFLKRKRGATLLSYGLLIGLIAITSIFAISNMGAQVKSLFELTGNTLENIDQTSSATNDSGASGGDVTPPIITSLTSNAGPFTTGQTIIITLDANEDLSSNGVPQLTLDIGGNIRVANFSSIVSGNAEFSYIVQIGDTDSDGFEITAFALGVNGLTDAAGNGLDTSGFTIPHLILETINPPAAGTILTSFAAFSTPPVGLAWDGSNIWNALSNSVSIHRHNPITGAITATIPRPDTVNGITWDGTSFWAASPTSDLIYNINASTGAVISSFAAPAAKSGGLTWDGTNLWVSDIGTNIIYKINPTTGATISSFAAPLGSFVLGLTWDGTYLWASDINTDTINKLNPITGAVISSFAAPGSAPTGLAWDGTAIWVASDSTHLIYRVSP